MVDLRHFRYFVAVAEEQHFGRAAERLHMTLPPLSMQIRQLEDHIGVSLFERGKRPIQMSAAGRDFYVYARTILQQSDTAVNRARQSAAGELGNLTVAVTAASLLGPLPSRIGAFNSRYTGVTLTFREMITRDQLQALENRLIDLGVMRPTVLPDHIRSRVILSEPLIVALPYDHPLTAYERIAPEQLNGCAFINYDRKNSPYFYRLAQTFLLHQHLQTRVILEASQLTTMIALVGTGAGIAIIPKAGANIRIQGVEFRPFDLAKPPRSELLVCWHSDQHNPILENLLHILAPPLTSGE
jgi:DNA-binding transcriptional LysR family regulator